MGQNKYVPSKSLKDMDRPPWMTPRVQRLVAKKRKMWKKYRNRPSEATQEVMKGITKRVTQACKRAKEIYQQRVADGKKTMSKEFWRMVRQTTTNRQGVGPLME